MQQHSENEWTFEEHQLSEGFSCVVYDGHGKMVADHLDRETAAKVSAAHEMFEALQVVLNGYLAVCNDWALPAEEHAEVLGPMTGLDWLNHFERFARDLEAGSIARTGYPLPKSEGFSVDATPRKDT